MQKQNRFKWLITNKYSVGTSHNARCGRRKLRYRPTTLSLERKKLSADCNGPRRCSIVTIDGVAVVCIRWIVDSQYSQYWQKIYAKLHRHSSTSGIIMQSKVVNTSPYLATRITDSRMIKTAEEFLGRILPVSMTSVIVYFSSWCMHMHWNIFTSKLYWFFYYIGI